MPEPAARSFRATLEPGPRRLGWTTVRIPFDVQAVWNTRRHLRVKGEINGVAFRSTLFPTGAGAHWMLINKKLQAAAGVFLGSTAKIRIEPDTEVRPIVMPPELERALAEDRSLRRWFDGLGNSLRRWIVNWVTGPKTGAARQRRAAEMAERLLATREAERELPPMLHAAFSRDARALAGWKRMPPVWRRHELLAILFYKSPEARARRIAKTMQAARLKEEKKAGKEDRRRSFTPPV